MLINGIKYTIFFIFLTACSQRSLNTMPEGVVLLKDIDPVGLQSPIWSPNGKIITASYVIEAMPDFAGLFGHKPRHDIVIIDTETWESIILVNAERGNLVTEAWLPDSKSFTMFWSDGPNGNGVYLFEVDVPNPIYYSRSGAIKPDLEKTAIFDEPNVRLTSANAQDIKEFIVPLSGKWSIYDWSPDMKHLILIYQQHDEERYNDIYLLDIDSGSFTQITNDGNYIYSNPSISPDGQLAAFIMRRFTEDDLEIKLLISRLDINCEWTIPLENIFYYTWSPDSQRIFLVGRDGVYLADLHIVFRNISIGNDCP